ncbi:MAG: hypothetical protein EKK33_08945 [Bradyrhizobiaceae bacterium]|nr:MAG: hypothetical protein EKK33_08945 [Bradyrhizobiaceae bacterium]
MTKPSRKLSALARTRRRNAARRAKQRRKTPNGRLFLAGATHPDQIKRRLDWLALEWNLPAPPKVYATPTTALISYIEKHGILFDWMVYGRVRDLVAMKQARRMAPQPSLAERCARLPPQARETIRKVIDGLLMANGEPCA